MINTVITLLILIGITDTVIGNYIFPGKVQVVRINDYYYVSKWNRLMLIPIKTWVQFNSSTPRDIASFEVGIQKANAFHTKERAIEVARIYSNKVLPLEDSENREVVWSSTQTRKRKSSDNFESMKELTSEMLRLEREGRPEEANLMHYKLQELHNMLDK